MKNTSFTVNSISAAWAKINEIFPSDYNKDEASSERAGYNIFRSSVEHYNYICDLGNRLEVNLASGETVNIWIREKDEAALQLFRNDQFVAVLVCQRKREYKR